MAKKRLIGTVVVKQGWAVQSFGYSRYLPLGKPVCVIENLDRWEVDEILLLCVDRSGNSLGPDFELLEKIASLNIKTPLIYGGGVRNVEDAVSVVRTCAERVVVDHLINAESTQVTEISYSLGGQAVIGCVPVKVEDGKLHSYSHVQRTYQPGLSDELQALISKQYLSELMLVDVKNEGKKNGFDKRIVQALEDVSIPKILFGGISEPAQVSWLLSKQEISAVAVGNFLNYREHEAQRIKTSCLEANIRSPKFEVF